MNVRRMSATGVALLAAPLVLAQLPAFAVNPNTGTIPSTGQDVTIEITSPTDGATVPAFTPLDVSGTVDITPVDAGGGDGDQRGGASAVFAIDVSSSTTNPGTLDCNGDGELDGDDDLNNAFGPGDILDCEIAGVIALNDSLINTTGVDVGIVGFASDAAIADVGPGGGHQAFTSPAVDANANQVRDLEDVARSAVESNVELFTPTGSLGAGTDFGDALDAMNSAFALTTTSNNVGFLLSDGNSITPNSEIADAAAAGTVIHTFAIGPASNCAGALQAIADGTGGTCTEVEDPTTLGTVLTNVTPAGIDRVEVEIDGGATQVADLDFLGGWSATLPGGQLSPGTHTIEATVFADDQAVTSVTADITVSVDRRPAPACAEDGLQSLLDGSGVASGTVHDVLEPVVNPLLDALSLGSLLHDVNCQLVVPVEDLVDSILGPILSPLSL